MDISQLSAMELKEKLAKRELSSKELTQKYIDKIEADQSHEKPLNAVITLLKDQALSMAENADTMLARGETKPLLGLPIIIKDNINIKGVASTCASKILKGYTASFDSTVVKNLKEAGAVLLAKSNMDEFAMGSSSEYSAAGAVRNHLDRDRSPGGSSGGSATSIGAKWAPLALGSDTGGSIRQPASFCGVVGMKPTYGRVSRYGLVAFSSSLDQIGPFANSVKDLALVQNVISSYDANDSTSCQEPVPDYLAGIEGSIQGKKIGLPKEYFSEDLDPLIKEKVDQAADQLKQLGCELVEISLPHTDYGIPVYYLIATAEASSNLSRFDGIRYGARNEASNLYDTFLNSRSEGFGVEVKRRIILGTYALSSGYYDAYYLKAQKARTLIKNDFVNAFKDLDAILAPTTPSTAFKIGEKVDDPLQMYLSDLYTVNINLAGLPALSLPYGNDANGLAVGIQLIANYFHEKNLLNIAWQLESTRH